MLYNSVKKPLHIAVFDKSHIIRLFLTYTFTSTYKHAE